MTFFEDHEARACGLHSFGVHPQTSGSLVDVVMYSALVAVAWRRRRIFAFSEIETILVLYGYQR